MWQDSFAWYVNDSFACATWPTQISWAIHVCDITHLHVWYDSFTCVIRLIHTCDMTHSHCDMTHSNLLFQYLSDQRVWRDSFTCVTRIIYTCDMTHSHVRHDSFACATWLIRIYSFIIWAIYTREMTLSHRWRHNSNNLAACRPLVCCSMVRCFAVCGSVLLYTAVCCSMLRCVAVCCSMLQCVAVCCSVLQYVAVCCNVLQCVAVCCSLFKITATISLHVIL